MRSDGRWPIDEMPEGCRECGGTEKPHKAQGLCTTCYARQKYREKAAAKRGDPVVPEPEPAVEDDFNPYAADLEAKFPSGEVRPGSSPSPGSPPETDVPAGVIPDAPTTPLGRLFGKKKKPDSPPPTTPPLRTKEKRPGGVLKRRRSVAGDLEQLFGSIGARLARVGADGMPAGRHYSLGQYLQWNAPASAEVIDDALKDTVIDRKVLQPISGAKDKVGAVGGVVGPPLLIFAIEANPNLFTALAPALYMAIEASLDSLLPAKKRAEARAKKRADAIREAFGDDTPPGVDPVASMIESLFPWAFIEGPPQPAPEGAVHENA